MEPESSSPYPQVPATCPYPEPTPSSPHDTLQTVSTTKWLYFAFLTVVLGTLTDITCDISLFKRHYNTLQ
jgi:hypothetical protein